MAKSPKRAKEPSNASLVATLQRKNPNNQYRVCPVCGDYALIWTNDEFYGMHPMGCFDTPKGQRTMYQIRKEREKSDTQSTQKMF